MVPKEKQRNMLMTLWKKMINRLPSTCKYYITCSILLQPFIISVSMTLSSNYLIPLTLIKFFLAKNLLCVCDMLSIHLLRDMYNGSINWLLYDTDVHIFIIINLWWFHSKHRNGIAGSYSNSIFQVSSSVFSFVKSFYTNFISNWTNLPTYHQCLRVLFP